jgi:hypothetical protein
MQEEDNGNQDTTAEIKRQSVRDQFLKAPMDKPAPGKMKVGQSAASNTTHTKTNTTTTTPPSTTPTTATS